MSDDLLGASRDRQVGHAAALIAVAAILSGPVGMGLAAIQPQPVWRDAATYAAHHHPLQQAPFWFGFLLIAGCVAFIARVAMLAAPEQRPRALIAIIVTAAFAAMIVINYTLQLAVVPALARTGDPALGYLVMTNPRAISWALEMFGYGLFGVATWLVAAQFGAAVAWLLRANGVISVVGAILTGIDLAWVHTTAGLLSFAGWNVLLIGTMATIAVAATRSGPPARG